MRRWLVVFSAGVLAAAGCSGPAEPGESPAATQDPVTQEPTSSPGPTSISWSGLEALDDESTVPLLAAAVSGPGGFVANRERPGLWEDGPTTALYFSPDGESWEQTFESAGLSVDLAVGASGYVAVGSRYQVPGVGDLSLAPWAASSADGQTWEIAEVTLPPDETPDAGGAALGPHTVGGPVFVPVTVDGPVIQGTWLSNVVATEDGFVALGHSQRTGQLNILFTSTDGKAWSPQPEDPFGGEVSVRTLVAGSNSYVAYGYRETEGDYFGEVVAWRSDDAVTWELATGTGFANEFGEGPFVGGLVAFGDGFLMVGTEFVNPPVAWRSADGSEWGEPVRLPSLSDMSAEIHGVAASPDLVVAVGREVVTAEGNAPATQYPGIWTSTDGAEWSQVSVEELRGERTEAGITIDSVAWTGQEWVALGKVWDYPDEIATAVAWTGR